MTPAEIIQEIEKLSDEERQLVKDHLHTHYLMGGAEIALIQERCIQDEAHPEQRIPWQLSQGQCREALLKKKRSD